MFNWEESVFYLSTMQLVSNNSENRNNLDHVRLMHNNYSVYVEIKVQ